LRLQSLVCGLLVAGTTVGCGMSPRGRGVGVTDPGFPERVGDWTAEGVTETYDTETIYDYIDGHAEVYLAYGMRRCLSQRYLAPDGKGEIVVDLFEMASPADAFGVFSHDRAGDEIAVGQGGVYRHGWLSFWEGSWNGSIYASTDGEDAEHAVIAIGEAVSKELPGGGEVPTLVNRLPQQGLDPASVCFLRSVQILNAHVWVGSDNLFELGPETEAVVGAYDLDGLAIHLLVIRYPDDASAARAEARVRDSAATSAAGLPAMTVGRAGDLVAAMIGPDIGEAGDALIEQALGGAR